MIFFRITKCLILGLLLKCDFYNEKIIKIFLNNIYKCGVIPVKMVQWGLPLMKLLKVDKNIINVLENTYEKCPIHELEYTSKIFKNDLYDDLNNYDVLEVIGSGSIAQVYKIKDKKGNLYALKVKHPNVDSNFNYIKLLLKIIFTFIPFNKIIPVSLDDFLNNFEKQLNLINEGNNLIKFNNLYDKNNPLYKIPKLYKLSENIIMMEYLEGVSLEHFKDNNYRYSKFNLFISIFMQNNLYINKYNHGDLHNYNWKITNDNKIVIYDYGLCWELQNDFLLNNLNDLIDGLHDYNYDIIYTSYYNIIKYNSAIDDIIIYNYFEEHKKNITRIMDFFHHIIVFSIKHNIILDITLLYIIISWQNIALIFMNDYCDTNEFEHNSVYMEEYSICNYYKIFPEYQQFLKKQINKYDKKINIDYNKLNKFIH